MRRLIVALFLATAVSANAESLVLAGGRLIDGFGGPPVDDAAVVIDGNRIVAAGPLASIKIPPGARMIDTDGMTMMPGIMDMHVHLM
ncbi:MAG TPA: Xaa-Pro dipeptidase, partial [Thermoanaerobaculia bacterium]|nr:Xaa-Pro dipeptidase [Thermoanaerobaculia bacterium]